MKRHAPLRLTDSDFKTGIEFARKIKQENPDRYETARQILLTHLPLHENITETVQSIITEYSLDYDTRMLFIGVAGIIEKTMQQAIKQGLMPEKFWVRDIDGNVLKTYRVGKYLVTENLKTEHYSDGTPIPVLEDDTKWANDTAGAMCYPNNYLANKEQYGALYNFYAVETGKLAPSGWRVPSDEEWREITLGMSKEEADKDYCWRGKGTGDKMKEVLGVQYSGYRGDGALGFYNLGSEAIWWSSTAGGTGSWVREIYVSYTSVHRFPNVRSYGFSVRCVRNLTPQEIDELDDLIISTSSLKKVKTDDLLKELK